MLFLSVIAIIIFVCGAFFTMGGIFNNRNSVPPGLYWKVDKPLGVGKIVVFCPPNRPEFQEARNWGYIETGNCPDNFGNMMLKVAAKRKNSVTINENGVYVDDVLQPQSKPLIQDKEGRIMPKAALEHYELKENEILLLSNSTDEPFDSRYFGIIDVEQVDSVVSPLFN